MTTNWNSVLLIFFLVLNSVCTDNTIQTQSTDCCDVQELKGWIDQHLFDHDVDLTKETITDLTDQTGKDGGVTTSLCKAFVVTDQSQLPGGRKAQGKVGDLVLQNSLVTFVIGAQNHSIWGPAGGGIIDAVAQGAGDRIQEVFPVVGFMRGVKPDSVQVLSGDGDICVVRVVGRDCPIPLLEAAAPLGKFGLDVVIDYKLYPDSSYMEIETTITNNGTKPVINQPADALLFGDTLAVFAEGIGYDIEDHVGLGSLAFVGADSNKIAYLVVPQNPPSVTIALKKEEILMIRYLSATLQPGESTSIIRRFYVKKGGSLAVLASWLTDDGTDLVQTSGALSLDTKIIEAGYDLSKISGLVKDTNGQFRGRFFFQTDGKFAFSLPSGKYSVEIRGPGIAANSDFVAGEDGPKFFFPNPGAIRIGHTCDEGNGKTTSCPVRVTVQSGISPPSHLGPYLIDFAFDGHEVIFLAPGDYLITVSRGFEYELCSQQVKVNPGEIFELPCVLKRCVDTKGWIAADLHVHSEVSIDSTLTRDVRIAALAAEGVEFFASTDHDIFTDFSEHIQQTGFAAWVTSSIGNEISPLYGHFNCLGCKPKTWDYFEVQWVVFDEHGEVVRMKEGPEIWADLRNNFSASLIQINHPRATQGFFDYVGYDPSLGPQSCDAEKFDLNFDVLEVWNSHDSFDSLFQGTLLDWYSLLNRGINKPASGNSDSHAVSQYVGHPRNYVQVNEPDETKVYQAIKQFHSLVSGGPFIRFSINGISIGGTVALNGQPAVASVEVLAPTWMHLHEIVLVGNGEIVESWDVSDSQGVLRLSQQLELSPMYDTWYHVLAWDKNKDMAPVYKGRYPIAFTNPIWVDIDGDGFEPPIQ